MKRKEKEGKGGRSLLSALLAVVFLAFALTSGMVGYLLGKGAARSGGKLVDTIVLSPGDSSLRAQPTLHFLAGKLLRQTGEPLSGATVRLGDGERSDVTDKEGKFYLSDVRSGEQALEVLDERGNQLASAALSLDFSGEEGISADMDGDPVAFRMTEDTRMLEITLTLEEDSTLVVEKESPCLVMKDGQVVNFESSAFHVSGGDRAVTPGGNLVDSHGYVLLPSLETAITPQGSQLQPEAGEEAIPGVILQEDGSAAIEEMAVLRPSGEVILPTGETVGGDGGSVVVLEEGGEAEELQELPDAYVPALPANGAAAGSAAGAASHASDGTETAGEVGLETEQEPDDGLEAKAGGFEIIDSATGISWQQQSVVDLFRKRYRKGKEATTDEDGDPIAAPGDAGYYDFQLKNPEDFDISYTIAIQEKSFHLPIQYSVVDASNNKNYLRQERVLEGEALVSPKITIPAGSVQNFRIEWRWLYEDYYYKKKYDAMDTAAGLAGQTYAVSMFIQAEGLPNFPAGGENTKYPGVHGNTEGFYDRLEEQRKKSR